MEKVGVFLGHLYYCPYVCITAIWYILWPYGKSVAIWYIFPRFGILCREKSGNPGPNLVFVKTKTKRFTWKTLAQNNLLLLKFKNSSK
jgi:hypothetical protein